jgi:hypothetical protein
VRRLPTGEIEAMVMAQMRALLRQPEIVVGTWRAAQAETPNVTEAEVREAMLRLDPLWDELFPGEQERIVRLLVERVTVTDAGTEIRLNLEGLAGLGATWRRSSSERRSRHDLGSHHRRPRAEGARVHPRRPRAE